MIDRRDSEDRVDAEAEERDTEIKHRRATDDELEAWENQCDPRLPRCLADAIDKLEHLATCRRCRMRQEWY